MLRYTALLGVVMLAACNDASGPPAAPPRPASIDTNAASWVIAYSPNMPAAPRPDAAGWTFDFPQVDGVHYVLTPVNGYASTEMRVTFNITTVNNPLFDWRTNPDNTCGSPPSTPATVRLFLQQVGDDMQGTPGTTEFYRWWSNPTAAVLAPGGAVLAVPIDPAQWSSVLGKMGTDAPAQFQNAVTHLGNVGMTFGGGCFFGHGVFVTGGAASFTLTGSTIQ